MPNNMHLILVPVHELGLRAGLAAVYRRYARMINFREGRRVHLGRERFHSFVIVERHLLAAADRWSLFLSSRGSLQGLGLAVVEGPSASEGSGRSTRDGLSGAPEALRASRTALGNPFLEFAEFSPPARRGTKAIGAAVPVPQANL